MDEDGVDQQKSCRVWTCSQPMLQRSWSLFITLLTSQRATDYSTHNTNTRDHTSSSANTQVTASKWIHPQKVIWMFNDLKYVADSVPEYQLHSFILCDAGQHTSHSSPALPGQPSAHAGSRQNRLLWKLFGINSTRCVWRKKKDKYNPKNTIPTMKQTLLIMNWE